MGTAARNRRDTVREVVKRCGGKIGVREKVEDVLERMTEVEMKDGEGEGDGVVTWVEK